MRRSRPWTPLDYALAPTAFWLTHVVRPIFDAICPEPPKYKYRVADSRTDAEPIVAEKQTGAA